MQVVQDASEFLLQRSTTTIVEPARRSLAAFKFLHNFLAAVFSFLLTCSLSLRPPLPPPTPGKKNPPPPLPHSLSYWKKGISQEELLKVAADVEAGAWKLQADAGIALVGLDGTLYDQVLDWTFYLGLAPARFAALSGLDKYFAMARGTEGAGALDMSKFFDTNYHYMVPELDTATLTGE